jgi:4'-phosphopantetheinyl transferase
MCASVRECPASGKSNDSGVEALYCYTQQVDMPIAGIHVWLVRLDIDDCHIATCEELLSGEERQHAVRLTIEQIRKRYVCGRALLRALLARYLQKSPHALKIQTGRFGKPALAGEPSPVNFNFSHAEDRAVLGISRTYEVGVDIESLRPKIDEDALAQRFFSAAEYTEFQLVPKSDRKRAFLDAWTGKEAVAKALGRGLYAPFHEIEARIGSGIPPQLLAVPTRDIANWRLHLLDAGPDYVAIIALRGRSPSLQYSRHG